ARRPDARHPDRLPRARREVLLWPAGRRGDGTGRRGADGGRRGRRDLARDGGVSGRRQSMRTIRSRSALAITLTDDSAIAAAAMTGDSRMPKTGYRIPAATGTPAAL